MPRTLALGPALAAGLAAPALPAEPFDLLCTFERDGKTYGERLSIDLEAQLWRGLTDRDTRPVLKNDEFVILLRDERTTRKGLPDFFSRAWVDRTDLTYHWHMGSADGYARGVMDYACKTSPFTPFSTPPPQPKLK